MYSGLKLLHSSSAYLTLAFLIIAVLYCGYCWLSSKEFSKTNKIIALVALIFSHLQLLLGLILYFVSPMGMSNFSGASMKDSMSRLYILEHPLTMIIALVLITIGYSKSKRKMIPEDKNKMIAVFYLIGLILIASRIPWSVWPV